MRHLLAAMLAATAQCNLVPVGAPMLAPHRRLEGPVLRRPVAALIAEPFTNEQAIDFALDNGILALKYFTYVLDIAIFAPLLAMVPPLQPLIYGPLRPLVTTATVVAEPYFAFWRGLLPLQFGGLDLSYVPAFYSLSFVRRELQKKKYERAVGKYRAQMAQLEQFYAK